MTSQGAEISPAVSHGSGGGAVPIDAAAVYAKVGRRLIPVLFACYVFNFMDRINIGFAHLQMKDDLGFGDEVFGIAASIFFVGYAIFEVPSNILLQRIGARVTFLRIMLCWGAISAATMFVTTPHQFYLARFLLGVFEAGFFPGVIYYLSQWYPDRRRAKVIGLFMTATVVAPLISSPASGVVMTYFDGEFGLRGWKWLLLVEGLPSMIMGVIVYFFLSDRPSEAKWLNNEEKHLLESSLTVDDRHAGSGRPALPQILLDWRVYIMALIYFLVLLGGYSLLFWQPSMLRSFGLASTFQIGLYLTIPAAAGVAAMILLGRHSDMTGERRWHFALSSLIGASGLSLTAVFTHNPVIATACLALAMAGIAGCNPVFWAVPTAYLSKKSAAAGIALISTLAVTSGAVGPALMGFLRKSTGEYGTALHIFSGGLILAGILMLTCMPRAMVPGPQTGQ